MKRNILAISLIAIVLAITACAPVDDDLFTTARITIEAGDGTTVTGVQAQAKLTNVNTRQEITAAGFAGNSITVELLRGAYQINIEGVAACAGNNGDTRHRQFRCQTDYAELVQRGMNEITLKIIFLD